MVGYDDHLNMMMESATIKKQGVDQHKKLMYLRGDTVVLVAKK